MKEGSHPVEPEGFKLLTVAREESGASRTLLLPCESVCMCACVGDMLRPLCHSMLRPLCNSMLRPLCHSMLRPLCNSMLRPLCHSMLRPLCKPQRERVVSAVHHNMVDSPPFKEKSSYPAMSYLCKESDFINEDFEPNHLIDILKMLGLSSLDCLKLPLVCLGSALIRIACLRVSLYEYKHILL